MIRKSQVVEIDSTKILTIATDFPNLVYNPASITSG